MSPASLLKRQLEEDAYSSGSSEYEEYSYSEYSEDDSEEDRQPSVRQFSKRQSVEKAKAITNRLGGSGFQPGALISVGSPMDVYSECTIGKSDANIACGFGHMFGHMFELTDVLGLLGLFRIFSRVDFREMDSFTSHR